MQKVNCKVQSEKYSQILLKRVNYFKIGKPGEMMNIFSVDFMDIIFFHGDIKITIKDICFGKLHLFYQLGKPYKNKVRRINLMYLFRMPIVKHHLMGNF